MHFITGQRARLLAALFACAALLLSAAPSHANPKYAGIVIDVNSGKVLYNVDADEQRYPASLTKMMTIYIAFEEMGAGRMTVDTRLGVSAYAAGRPPTKIGVRVGTSLALGDAIKALVTRSANDASVVIAEAIEGSEAAFARRMTRTAHRLGMRSTKFRNANGLPDAGQVTTARDMSTLGIALQRDFPQFYGVFSTRSFTYGKARFGNHNRLLAMEGVDGIKTGYIRASGFNLVTSLRRDGKHIVGVVIGGRSGASRDTQMRKLLAEYLPKATVGSEMLVASWQDTVPPPLPGKKPSLSTIYAARLLARAAEPDPIAETLLAYAVDSAGARPTIITPELATGALEAVIAAAGPTRPAADGLTAVALSSPAPRGDLGAAPPLAESVAFAVNATPSAKLGALDADVDALTAYAADALTEVERAAILMAAPAVPEVGAIVAPPAGSVASSPADARFALAFGSFDAAPAVRRLRQEDVLAAVERARPPRGATVELGSAALQSRTTLTDAPAATATAAPASPPAGATPAKAARNPVPTGAAPAHQGGWSIQVGAVGSAREATAVLADAETRVPALKDYERVTVTVSTEKGTFYRARFAGFTSEREAKQLCERFSNHNRPCWAVAM